MKILKRLFDLTSSLAFLILLSPLLAGIAALARLLLGSPVFVRQLRPGLHGRPFTLLKFRTMHVGSEVPIQSGRRRPAHRAVVP